MRPIEQLPNGWHFHRLGDIARLSGALFRVALMETYQELSLRLYGQGFEVRREVSGTALIAEEMQRLKEGQLVTSIHQFRNGAIGIVPSGLAGSILSKNFLVYDLDKSVVDGAFLVRFLTAPSSVSFFQANSTGSATPIFPKAMIEQVEVPLPPLSEQRRIVAWIEELAAKVEEARSLRKQAGQEADAIPSSVMQRYFSFDKAVTSVGDYARVQGGYAFPSGGYEETGSHQVVRIGNVRDGFLDLSRAPVRWNPTGDLRVLNYKLHPGDVVISMTGTREKRDYGFVAIVPEGHQLLLNQRVGRFNIHREVQRDYLFHFLRSPYFRDRLFPSATGTANQANVGNGDIERVRFAPPSIPEQHRIVAELDALQARVDALKKLQTETATELDALLPSILDRAFKGEL